MVVSELRGEKIDIIPFNEEPARFVAKALSPARVREVLVDDEAKQATVIVPDDQLSLAIGKDGLNARLAARLTGWRVDIRSETEFAEEEAEMGYAGGGAAGRCAAILANGKRCPNASLPGSRYCGLPAHQALEGTDTDYLVPRPRTRRGEERGRRGRRRRGGVDDGSSRRRDPLPTARPISVEVAADRGGRRTDAAGGGASAWRPTQPLDEDARVPQAALVADRRPARGRARPRRTAAPEDEPPRRRGPSVRGVAEARPPLRPAAGRSDFVGQSLLQRAGSECEGAGPARTADQPRAESRRLRVAKPDCAARLARSARGTEPSAAR